MDNVVDNLIILVKENNKIESLDLSEYEDALATYGDVKIDSKYELALSGVSYLDYNSNYQFSTSS